MTTATQAGLRIIESLTCPPGRLIPLTVDGLIYASSMAMLDSARRGVPVPSLARRLLGLGIVETLALRVWVLATPGITLGTALQRRPYRIAPPGDESPDR